MSILDANGAIACAECGRQARAVRDQLKAENAQLRELVRAAWQCIHTEASCSDCCLIAGGCTLQSAMRELGVEVE